MKSEITKEYIRKNCVMSTTTTTKSNNFDKQEIQKEQSNKRIKCCKQRSTRII